MLPPLSRLSTATSAFRGYDPKPAVYTARGKGVGRFRSVAAPLDGTVMLSNSSVDHTIQPRASAPVDAPCFVEGTEREIGGELIHIHRREQFVTDIVNEPRPPAFVSPFGPAAGMDAYPVDPHPGKELQMIFTITLFQHEAPELFRILRELDRNRGELGRFFSHEVNGTPPPNASFGGSATRQQSDECHDYVEMNDLENHSCYNERPRTSSNLLKRFKNKVLQTAKSFKAEAGAEDIMTYLARKGAKMIVKTQDTSFTDTDSGMQIRKFEIYFELKVPIEDGLGGWYTGFRQHFYPKLSSYLFWERSEIFLWRPLGPAPVRPPGASSLFMAPNDEQYIRDWTERNQPTHWRDRGMPILQVIYTYFGIVVSYHTSDPFDSQGIALQNDEVTVQNGVVSRGTRQAATLRATSSGELDDERYRVNFGRC